MVPLFLYYKEIGLDLESHRQIGLDLESHRQNIKLLALVSNELHFPFRRPHYVLNVLLKSYSNFAVIYFMLTCHPFHVLSKSP